MISGIKEAVDEIIKQKKRYYFTIQCVLGIKFFFETKKDIECKFIGSEITMEYENQELRKAKKAPRPDFLLQNKKNNYGVFGEIKGSISLDKTQAKKELLDLQRLNNNIVNWKTSDKKIQNFGVCFIIYRDDSLRCKHLVQEMQDKGELKLKRDLAIYDWSLSESIRSIGEALFITKQLGKTGLEELDKFMDDNEIQILLDEYPLEYEKVKFIRHPPPILYTMNFLWFDVFSTYSVGETFRLKLSDLFKDLEKYYPPWANIDGENRQIREKWIKEALENFCLVDLGKALNNEKNEFEIFWGKQIKKDFDEYIAEKLCKRSIKIKQSGNPKQKTLNNI